MKRTTLVIFAIVAAFLMVAGQPAAAANASGSLEVASKNTTDTDFNNSQTLVNATVEGTGQSANVSALSSDISGSLGSATGTVDRDDKVGVEVVAKEQITEFTVDYYANHPATTAYLVDSGGSTITSASISGDSVTLSGFTVNAGETVYLVHDAGGSLVTYDNNDAPPYVVETSQFNITAGAFNNGGGTTQNFNYGVQSVSTTVTDPSAQYVGANHTAENAEKAWANLTLTNAQATVEWQVYDGTSWSVVNSTTLTSGGNQTLDISSVDTKWRVNISFDAQAGSTTAKLHDEGVLFDASATELSNPNPSDTQNVSNYDGNIRIDVSDGDFSLAQGDSVTVEAYNTTGGNNSLIGSDTVSSNGTVSIPYSPIAGENSIRWEASDNYGFSDQQSVTFSTPSTLYIRNESQPTQLITDATIDITFYASDTSVTNTTSDGTVSLDGLPADEKIVGVVTADGYYNRHIIIQSIFDQESVYLLDQNVSAVEDRFTLADQSGQFESDESEVIIKRPLTRDYDGDGSNETRYETVAADKFGVAGYTLFLEEGVRYRIAVRDDENFQVLGPYTADVSETVTLSPGEFEILINQTASGYYSLAFYEEYEAGGGEHQRITFEYYDAENETTELEVTVVEQNNRSNELEPTQTISGPIQTTSLNFNLTDEEANKTWIVDWQATKGGEVIEGEEVVGKKVQMQAPNFPAWVKEATAAAIVILTLALFSRVNRETGAVTASMVGGGFWFGGWLPTEAGAAIVIALVVSVLVKTGLPEV